MSGSAACNGVSGCLSWLQTLYGVAPSAASLHDEGVKRLWGAVLAAFVASSVAQGCTKTCETSSDCGSGEACLFPIGSCTAQGQCMKYPDNGSNGCGGGGGECGYVQGLPGCNGALVSTGCGYPDGYANGPTLGPATETSGGSDAGKSGFFDATLKEAGQIAPVDGAGESGEAGEE